MTEPTMGFGTDLQQLDGVAKWRLPQIAVFLEYQAHRFGEAEGLGDPAGWSSSLNSTFLETTEILRDRARDAAEAVRASAQALQDVAALYRRADGQG